MATKLEELVVQLRADVKELNSGLKSANETVKKSSDQINKNIANTEQKTTKSFFNMKKAAEVMAGFIGGNLVLGAFSKLSSFVGESFRNVRDFSKGIAEINTLLPKNAKLTKENTNQFIKYSNAYGKSVQSQTKAFYDIVSAGVEGTSKQMAVLNQANQAALAGLVDVGVAADVLTSSMNAYAESGLSAQQASDALFAAVKAGKTTFGELASNIGKVAPLASAAGVEFSELTGTLAFLTKSGVSTDIAVTQMQAVISGLIKPAEDAKKAAKELGIEFSTSSLRAKGMAQFMSELIEKTNGNEEALARLFPNVRALNGVINIARGNFKDFTKILDENKNSLGNTAQAADDIKQSFDFKVEKLTTKFKNLGITLIEDLIPGFEILIGFLETTTTGFSKLLEVTSKWVGSKLSGPEPKNWHEASEGVRKLQHNLENAVKYRNKVQDQFKKGDQSGFLVSEETVELAQKRVNALEAELLKMEGFRAEFDPDGKKAAKVKGQVDNLLNNLMPDNFQNQDIEISIPLKIGEKDLSGGEKEGHKKPKAGIDPSAIDSLKTYTEEEKNAAKAGALLAESMIKTGGASKDSTKVMLDNLTESFSLGLISEQEYLSQKEGLLLQSSENELEVLKGKHEQELEQIALANEQKLISDEEFLESKKLLDQSYLDEEQARKEQQRLSLLKIEKQKKEAEEKLQREKFQNILGMSANFLQAGFNLSYAFGKKNKTLAKMEAVVSGGLAVQRAIANPPGYPFNLGFVALAISQTAKNIKDIDSVPLATGITEIPEGFPNDNFPARLTSGERVVDKDANSDLKEFLNEWKESGVGGEITIKMSDNFAEMFELVLTDRSDKGISKLRLK